MAFDREKFDSLTAAVEASEQRLPQVSALYAAERKPDEFATALDDANALGITPEAAKDNAVLIQQRKYLAAFDQFNKDAPRSAAYMHADPRRAALMQDTFELSAKVEALLVPKQSSLPYEIGRQFIGGLVTRTPQMIGRALEWYAPTSDIEVAKRTGLEQLTPLAGGFGATARAPQAPSVMQQLATSAQQAEYSPERVGKLAGDYWEEKSKEWEPDLAGRSELGSMLIKGASQLGPTIAAMTATAIDPAVGGTLTAAFFGGAQAQETYKKIIEAGGTDREATEAAALTGAIEGGGEALADVLGANFLTGAGRAFTSLSGKTAGEVAKAVTSPQWAMQFAKNWTANAAVQSSTEYAQAYGQTEVERAYGAETVSPHEAGIEGAKTALGMSILLGLPGGVGHYTEAQRRAKVGEALTDQAAPRELRLAAAEFVKQDIAPLVGEENAAAWAEQTKKAIELDAKLQLTKAEGEARATAAESAFTTLTALAKEAEAHPLRTRGASGAEAFKGWIESVADGTDLAEVYVNGAVLRDMLAESGIASAQLQAAVPEVANQLGDALATTGDVRIALHELLSSNFDAKLRDAILPHVKTTPAGMTFQESQGYFQTQVQELEQRAQQLADEAAPIQTREEYEAEAASLTTEADIVAEGRAAIEELTAASLSEAATPEQIAALATLADIADKPDALAQYFGKTITGEAPKSYDEYLASHSNTAAIRAKEVKTLREEIVSRMRVMNRFPEQVLSAYATPLTEFYLTQSAALKITPSELLTRLPISYTAEALGGGYAQATRLTLADVEKLWDEKGISHHLSEGENRITLSRIVVPQEQRKRGVGTEAMNALIAYADQSGKRVALSPATDFGATSEARLKKFYKRFGFVENKGRNKDLAISESMYRDPTNPDIYLQSAFHGSPYKFDKFTLAHIGKGEGAQAYGWGLYFAGKREVAEFYKRTLGKGTLVLDGAPLSEHADPYLRDIAEAVAFSASKYPGASFTAEDMRALIRAARPKLGSELSPTEYEAKQEFLLGKVDSGELTGGGGKLYQVEIPEDGEYLLWDTPLSEQPAKIREALYVSGYTADADEMTGRELYQDTSDSLAGGPETENPDELTSKLFHSLGIAGIKYLDGTSRTAGEGSYNYVIFDENAIRIVEMYYQTAGKQPRAYYDPNTFTTSILQGADLSSVLHESGHFYLEALRAMAEYPTAPQLVKDDWARTLKWFGVADTAAWDRLSIDEKREYHEQWAQSQERWMLEGKAPTLEMQPVFARFRSWLLNVYKSLEEFLRQNPLAGRLDDEMRGVFSRLLASEEAIKEAERSRGYAALFPDAQAAGVPNSEYEDYMRLGEQATADAVDDMQRRSVKGMQWLSNAKNKAIRKLQREADAKRKAIREEVTTEVMAEPVNQARTFLRTGETTDPTTGEQIKANVGAKLDTAAVKELFPATALAAPNLSKLRGMTSPDGLHPDLVAQMFGYRSGEALVLDLIEAEKAEDKIAGLTDQRMLERHGELTDPTAVERAAEAAIHNEARAKFMATGLQMLTKSPMPVREMVRAATEAAENTVARKKIRDIRPKQFEAAEARASKKAVAEAPRDPAKAAEAQRAALLNNRMARASTDALEEVEKALRYTAKFQSEGTRKNLDLEYLEQIDDLLAPFDMRTGQSLKEIAKRKSLAEWIERQESLGFEPAIDIDVAEEAKRKHYKEMTLEELRGLLDAVKSIEHLGRLKKKLLTAKDKREFAERIKEAVESITANANREVADTASPSDIAGRAADLWANFTAEHRKVASIVREMDGSQDGGAMWNLLMRPANEAGDNETRMRAEAAEKMAVLFTPILKKMTLRDHLKARRRVVPGTKLSMSYEERVMFAMNWGNDGNRQRLMDGGLSGKRSLTEKDAQAIIDSLDKEDMDFVQGVLDYVDTFRPAIAEQERRLTGKEPEWVEAAPIKTKFGTYRGGYFPAKYDAKLSTRSEALEAATTLRMGMKGAFGASAARNGYTKKRAEEVTGRPIMLSFDSVSQHVSEVTHRLAWQGWLVDANRILRALDGTIRDHYGAAILRQMRTLTEDIAAGDAPARNTIERAINHVRVGSTIVGMGWRVTTALLQPSGLAQSWVRVGGKWVANGVKQYAANPNAASELVNTKSKMMADRGRTMQREINEVLNTVRTGEKVSAVQASYFWMIAKMQRTVDIPTWLGAYEKAAERLNLAAARNEEERAAIEDKMIAMADQAVLDAQSGGQLKDLAAVQRGSPLYKLFTNFYSYFSSTYNLNVEAYRRTDFKDPIQIGAYAADILILNTLPVLFSVALKELMKGGCDNDDMECLIGKVGKEQSSYLFGQMVLLREVGAAASAATGDSFGYSGPAGLRFFNDLYKTGEQIGQGDVDFAAWKAASNAAGTLVHFPMGQVNATLEGIIAVENGDVEGAAIMPALVAGKPREEK